VASSLEKNSGIESAHAPANISYCATRHMMRHGSGRIVNISSRDTFRGEPNKPAYGAQQGWSKCTGPVFDSNKL